MGEMIFVVKTSSIVGRLLSTLFWVTARMNEPLRCGWVNAIVFLLQRYVVNELLGLPLGGHQRPPNYLAPRGQFLHPPKD
jgi:hypothetical protein